MHSLSTFKLMFLFPFSTRVTAIGMLVLATLFWGFSFSMFKSVALIQQVINPSLSSWLIAASSLGIRFLVATLVLALYLAWKRMVPTKQEWIQGSGLALTMGGGMLLQLDGMTHTLASTSAFLTQFYCILLPLIAAWQTRRWPESPVIWSVLMVITGVCILSGVDIWKMRMGRGEWETILASTVFALAILLLESPRYRENRPLLVTGIMSLLVTSVVLPITFFAAPADFEWMPFLMDPACLWMNLWMGLFATLGSYTLMITWQPKVSATEAGIIYCFEPLFASLIAQFLPALLSLWTGIHYPNEQVTFALLVGGGLILLANLILLSRKA